MIPLRYNIRSLLVRRTASIMTALGVALVVMILFILLGFIAGLQKTVLQAGNSGNWVVLSRGVTNEPGSYITREQFEIIRARPEIEVGSARQPLISPEMVTGFNASPDGAPSNSGATLLRGVHPIAYQVHRGMSLVSGRWPQPGHAEMIVGRKLAMRFPNLTPPAQMRFGRRMWDIVGVFSDDDSARESEMWTDLDVLQQDIRYRNGFAALHVVLKPGTEDEFKLALDKDVRLRVDAVTEAEFYSAMSQFADQLRAMGLVVASIVTGEPAPAGLAPAIDKLIDAVAAAFPSSQLLGSDIVVFKPDGSKVGLDGQNRTFFDVKKTTSGAGGPYHYQIQNLQLLLK